MPAIYLFDKMVSMVIMDTIFDFLSASGGAILGALVAFMLNRKRNRQMASQLIVSRQALDKIKLENTELLKQIQDKENTILQLEMQILRNGDDAKTQKPKTQKKK